MSTFISKDQLERLIQPRAEVVHVPMPVHVQEPHYAVRVVSPAWRRTLFGLLPPRLSPGDDDERWVYDAKDGSIGLGYLLWLINPSHNYCRWLGIREDAVEIADRLNREVFEPRLPEQCYEQF